MWGGFGSAFDGTATLYIALRAFLELLGGDTDVCGPA